METKQIPNPKNSTDKSVYSTPKLKSYGNAVEITLGGGGPNRDGGGSKSHK